MGKNLAETGYYMVTPMFKGVAGDICIKDIVPSASRTIGASEITLLVIDKGRKTVGTWSYKPEFKIGDVVFDPAGWYLNGGSLDEKTTFPKGSGFMIQCNYAITLTFSGEVVQTTPSFYAQYAGYYRVGNMNPTPVCIKDIIPTSSSTIETSKLTIQTFDKDRKPAGTWSYKPEFKIGDMVLDPAGWYLNGGTLDEKTTFQPGDGFLFSTEYDDTTLTFPDPIK